MVVDITDAGHIEIVRGPLFDSLSDRDVRALGDLMIRVRDHTREQPPRSAASRASHAAKDRDN